jgi:hypothetical protein
MQKLTPSALLLIAVCALSTGASAQNTYKCGNSYSQLPCPGGVVLDPRDGRDSSQKTQADTASLRDARVADALEAQRLQQAQKDLRANTPRHLPAEAAAPRQQGRTDTQASRPLKKKQQPAYFTAQVPGEKKKTSARKKKASDK